MTDSQPVAGRFFPQLIPVVDVLNGVVVQAVGGRRDEYVPLKSKLTDSTDVAAVIRDLLSATNSTTIYAADLDMILWGMGETPWDLLYEFPVDVILDGGGLVYRANDRVRSVESFECAGSLQRLRREFRRHSMRRPVFSVDLRAGNLVGPWQSWGLLSPRSVMGVVRIAHDIGFRSFIVLDLVHIGESTGGGTHKLCRMIRDEFPAVELISGGGVRSWDDVRRFGDAGCDGVLVSTALHDRSLTTRG